LYIGGSLTAFFQMLAMIDGRLSSVGTRASVSLLPDISAVCKKISERISRWNERCRIILRARLNMHRALLGSSLDSCRDDGETKSPAISPANFPS
jgi:hypothetical protein